MSKFLPAMFITNHDELDRVLRHTCEEEARLTGRDLSLIRSERNRWFMKGRRATWLRTKWRELNAVDVLACAWLIGRDRIQVRRAFNNGEFGVAVEPITGELFVPLQMVMAWGFSFDQVRDVMARKPWR